MFGVAHLSQIPLRKDPRHASEMVSQLLFGELYTFDEMGEEWTAITTYDCNYKGWIDTKGLFILTDDEARNYTQNINTIVEQGIAEIMAPCSTFSFPIYKGSTFPMKGDGNVYLGHNTYRVVNKDSCIELHQSLTLDAQRTRLLQFAKGYLNAPYLWGGRTLAGIDCSGLVQNTYKSIGLTLPRDASQQQPLGKLRTLQEAHPGDVAFFANKEGKITHTGILLDTQTIIHASVWVKIETIDNYGILKSNGEYSHVLHSIKSYISCF